MEGSPTSSVGACVKKEVIVANMKADYIPHSIEVTHFATASMDGQGLSIPSLDDSENVPAEMVVSVEEQVHNSSEAEEAELKHRPDKKRKIRVYSQKFRKDWLHLREFQGWLSEGSAVERAYCTVCNKELTAGKSELLKHAMGKKHKKRMAEAGSHVTVSSDLSSVLDETGIPHVLRIVDMRSDTVTQPSREMKEAMFDAPVGDDVFSEDSTVKALEEKVAKLLEKEAALYVPSGTMANLVCVLTHCWSRGSEIVVGDQSHLNLWAQRGVPQIGSVHHRTIKNQSDGTFSLQELRSLVRDDDPHWPVTTLVCVENTHNMMGGKALPLQWLDDLGALCNEMNLLLHMDGARLVNASVALGMSPARLVQSCNSATLCLNKGLGAPMGSLVVGTKEFIARAIRVRKVLGGGLHQAGMFAAAGIYALDQVAPRLSWDHTHARAIAQSVSEEHSSAITVDLKDVQTNVVMLHCDNIRVNAKKLCQRLSSVTDTEIDELGEQVIVLMSPVSDTTVRLMTHCDVKKEDVKAVIKKLKYIIREYDNMMYLEYKISV
ncbi:probable low-specificity L-threonine aldolase 2 [Penaeus japonicus]|uniref:probable low-specificity L-threonine aldolase 2 n=1 Tax=Penaeus japonicus TaxID=27405 RepID=UPI001C7130C3|nr:probable low-specificity L-threonine aldolase 2 [Penaeus japonicus]